MRRGSSVRVWDLYSGHLHADANGNVTADEITQMGNRVMGLSYTCAAGDPAMYCNQDSIVDIADLIIANNLYEAGGACPGMPTLTPTITPTGGPTDTPTITPTVTPTPDGGWCVCDLGYVTDQFCTSGFGPVCT